MKKFTSLIPLIIVALMLFITSTANAQEPYPPQPSSPYYIEETRQFKRAIRSMCNQGRWSCIDYTGRCSATGCYGVYHKIFLFSHRRCETTATLSEPFNPRRPVCRRR